MVLRAEGLHEKTVHNPYAMMIDLRGKPCLVVGGGKVAGRKVKTLIDAGAHVKVVSPAITPMIKYWALSRKVEWFARPYQQEDGAGQFLVVAATDDPGVNRTVYCHAKMRDQWINVVDQPGLCNFTIPAVLTRGKLQIAISTQGASPSVAKKIRRELEGMPMARNMSFILTPCKRCGRKFQSPSHGETDPVPAVQVIGIGPVD